MANIIGTGIDVIEVERIERALTNPVTGARFRNRVYTSGEISYCESRGRARYQSYAARFAAKEAAMKAIGTGWNRGVTWHDVEVSRVPGGRPTIAYHNKAAEFFRALGAVRAHLSITHTADSAMAQVILESD